MKKTLTLTSDLPTHMHTHACTLYTCANTLSRIKVNKNVIRWEGAQGNQSACSQVLWYLGLLVFWQHGCYPTAVVVGEDAQRPRGHQVARQ